MRLALALVVLACSCSSSASTKESCDARIKAAKLAIDDGSKPPWPTGNAATDKTIDAEIARFRDLDNQGPEGKAKQLADGVTPPLFPVSEVIKDCQPALAAYDTLHTLDASEKKVGIHATLDALGECACKQNVALAVSYLWIQRARVAGALLDPTFLKTPSELAK